MQWTCTTVGGGGSSGIQRRHAAASDLKIGVRNKDGCTVRARCMRTCARAPHMHVGVVRVLCCTQSVKCEVSHQTDRGCPRFYPVWQSYTHTGPGVLSNGTTTQKRWDATLCRTSSQGHAALSL
jgi:hypothetical protein